jgi:hypothetical protein
VALHKVAIDRHFNPPNMAGIQPPQNCAVYREELAPRRVNGYVTPCECAPWPERDDPGAAIHALALNARLCPIPINQSSGLFGGHKLHVVELAVLNVEPCQVFCLVFHNIHAIGSAHEDAA